MHLHEAQPFVLQLQCTAVRNLMFRLLGVVCFVVVRNSLLIPSSNSESCLTHPCTIRLVFWFSSWPNAKRTQGYDSLFVE